MTEEEANDTTMSTMGGQPTAPPEVLYPSRFPLWYALTVFSAISLISHATETDINEWGPEEKWVLSVTVISLVLSCVSCLMHIILGHGFIGMPFEGFLLFTQAGLWLGGLIVMMNTENEIAVNRMGGILNANLYFFSWASLITTIALFIGYGQEVSDWESSAGPPKSGYWAGLCVASLVALASSTQTFVGGVTILGEEFECQSGSDHGTYYCERLKFSISLSAVSTLLALVFCAASNRIPTTMHVSASIFSLFAWVFGVAFVTFGNKSPGNGVGNLFFGCWSSFILSLFMVSSSIKDYLVEKEAESVNLTGNEMEERPDNDTDDPEKGEGQPEPSDNEDAETASPSEAPNSPASTGEDKVSSTTAGDQEKVTPQKSNVDLSDRV